MACVRGRGWRVCVAWLLCAWLACAWVPCRGVCVHAGWRVCVGDVVCAWVARVRGGVYVCGVCACCVVACAWIARVRVRGWRVCVGAWRVRVWCVRVGGWRVLCVWVGGVCAWVARAWVARVRVCGWRVRGWRVCACVRGGGARARVCVEGGRRAGACVCGERGKRVRACMRQKSGEDARARVYVWRKEKDACPRVLGGEDKVVTVRARRR